jgi:hypothetical protein
VGPRRLGVCLSIAALAVAGCGGDDDEGGGTTTAAMTTAQPAATPAAQDAEAKANARNVVVLLEACFVDQQDYSACREAARTEEVGPATVESADAATYTVVSPSESGNEFRAEKTAAGTLERTCETAGAGGCRPNGTW